jgi:hypothetical protein
MRIEVFMAAKITKAGFALPLATHNIANCVLAALFAG